MFIFHLSFTAQVPYCIGIENCAASRHSTRNRKNRRAQAVLLRRREGLALQSTQDGQHADHDYLLVLVHRRSAVVCRDNRGAFPGRATPASVEMKDVLARKLLNRVDGGSFVEWKPDHRSSRGGGRGGLHCLDHLAEYVYIACPCAGD